MKVRMDKSGRLVVPKALRKRLGLEPGTELRAVERPDGILLCSLKQQPSMVRVDGLWVHQGTADTAANWACALESVRDERIPPARKPQ